MKNIIIITLVVIGAYKFFDWQYSRIDYMAENKINGYSSMTKLEKDLQCLTDNLVMEAGVEAIEGKLAVAQVTMNRVRDKRFGNDVCAVVYQHKQFSWTTDTPKNRNNYRNMNKQQYQESYDIAKKVLIEKFEIPSLRTALFYHADYVNPKWAEDKKKIIKIGRHIFYG